MRCFARVSTFVIALLAAGCWTWYTDNPRYKPEVTNSHASPPGGPVQHLGQWVGQMFDARLSLEILDGKCEKPTIYSDLEFQIRKKGVVLLKRQLDSKSFDAKVYLEKGDYEALLISFSRSDVIARKVFAFGGTDKKISLDVQCRQ